MTKEKATIDHEALTQVNGGTWDDLVNVGKGIVNGGVNALNFFHEHPVELGKLGTFTIGGSRVNKPFTNDPLSHIGVVQGHAVPAKGPKKR